MFRFREFRTLCRENRTAEIIELMSNLIADKAFDDYFSCCKFLSEHINKESFELSPELLNFLYSFSELNPPEIEFKENSRRVGIFIKNPGTIPIELLSCINRIYLTPIVILIGKSQENSDYMETLKEIDIAVTNIDYHKELDSQLNEIMEVCKTEKLSRIIIHANPADLDYLILSRQYKEHIISYHKKIPLIAEKSYCEKEDSLGIGSWKENNALALFKHYSAVFIPANSKFPEEIFDIIPQGKILLLNPNPLECLSNLNEAQIARIVFITEENEYKAGLKCSKELIFLPDSESVCLNLAIEFGLSLRFLENSKFLNYEDVHFKYSLKRKFTQVLATNFDIKPSYRKALPRVLLFRNDSAAPIIASINKNISAALRHAGCPTLNIDISPMAKASRNKDWAKLKEIQQDIRDSIDHFRPTQALGYNDTGIFPNRDSHMLEQMQIPYNGLFFDNPFYFFKNLKFCKDKSLIRIFTLDEFYIAALKEGGFTETHYMPIATSLHNHSLRIQKLFDPEKLIFTATVKPSTTAERLAKQVNNKNDKAFIEFAFNEIIENENYSIASLLENYKHFYSKDYIRFQNEVWFKIENQCSSYLRLKTAEALADFQMNIYGGSNWQDISLSHNHNFEGYMNYKDIVDAYRTSFAAVCRTPLNIQNGIQQRILDCGAAQGLIISDYRPILEEHFELDKELFTYRNCEELKDKVSFLKRNPAAAEKSKKLLHKKVLAQHTWDLRIQEVINFLI